MIDGRLSRINKKINNNTIRSFLSVIVHHIGAHSAGQYSFGLKLLCLGRCALWRRSAAAYLDDSLTIVRKSILACKLFPAGRGLGQAILLAQSD